MVIDSQVFIVSDVTISLWFRKLIYPNAWVIGAPLLGSYFSKWTGYSDRPLDALGAVIVAAIAIKLLTFVNSQDLGSLFGILSRLRGGGASNGNK